MKLRATILVLAGTLISIGCGSSHTADEDAAIVFDAAFPDAGPDGGPASSVVGAPCVDDTECTGGTTCLTDLPGGYCTGPCTTDTDCPEGGACIVVDRRGNSLCLDACDPSAPDQCRTGYGCALDGAICLPGCEDDTDCDTGRMCDPMGGFSGEGACYDPSSSLGDACAASDQCPAGGFCLSDRFGFPGGYCATFGCDPAANTGCADGGVCFPSGGGGGGGICFDGCTSDADCTRDGYECQDSLDFPGRRSCQPAFDPSNLGTVCSAGRGDCTGGACLTETNTGFPDSYCAGGACDPTATTPDCPGDGVCVETTSGGGICLDGCATTADCRTAYECRPSVSSDPSSATACLPGCTMDSQCSGGGMGTPMYVCNPGTGFCDEPFVETRLGEPCVDASDCPGGRCLGEDTDGWPAGTCTYPGCRLSGTGREAMCPTGGTCVDDGGGDPELGVCVDSCATSASGECRPGYACVELSTGSAEGACRPACTASDCGAGRTCNTTNGLCE